MYMSFNPSTSVSSYTKSDAKSNDILQNVFLQGRFTVREE